LVSVPRTAGALEDASVVVRDPLDWSIVKKATGETRWEHIQLHGVNDMAKPLHGVFDSDPVITTYQAWQRGQLQGIAPVLENGVDVYNIPMGGRVGWQGGYNGTGAPLSNDRIVTQPGTTKIITAHPN
jgi:hypothetical protein